MKRRDFLALLGAAVAVWPPAAVAQQPGRLPFVQFMESLYVESFDLSREPDRG
jgi:hypothetical protein